MTDEVAKPGTLAYLVVAFVAVLSAFLNYSGTLDSMGYWKVVGLSVTALLIGSPVTGMASVWTAAKVQEIAARVKQ